MPSVEQDDFERLRGGYANAWRARESGHSTQLLIDELDSLGDEVFSGPGPGRDLVLSMWERDVPPEALERELLRATPGLAWSATSSLTRAAIQIAGYLRPGGRSGDVQNVQGDPPEG